MKLTTVWNSLRVLAILGLGYVLFVQNTVGPVSSRRALFELIRDQPDLSNSEVHERLENIQDTLMRIVDTNSWAIPALVIIALSPHLRKKTKRTSDEEPGGSEQFTRTSAKT